MFGFVFSLERGEWERAREEDKSQPVQTPENAVFQSVMEPSGFLAYTVRASKLPSSSPFHCLVFVCR